MEQPINKVSPVSNELINHLAKQGLISGRATDRFEPYFTPIERTVWFEKEFKPVESYVTGVICPQ